MLKFLYYSSVEDKNEEVSALIDFRKKAASNIQKQAEKMIKRTRRKLQEAKVGNCVTIPDWKYDWGRGDPPNIVGLILEIKDNKYKIGTRGGIIEYWLERNGFECTKFECTKRFKNRRYS